MIAGMDKHYQRADAITPKVGDRVGTWTIAGRQVSYSEQEDGWAVEVWGEKAGHRHYTKVVVLEGMLADPKAAAYLEVILEDALDAVRCPCTTKEST